MCSGQSESSRMKEEALCIRFLDLLGIKIAGPSLPSLSGLIKAHLSKIPFENISKLYYTQLFGQKELPSFTQYLDGISTYGFGGTCYSNNYYFYRLLLFLGFSVRLCAADIKRPGTHMVIIVSIDQKEYLVDVGYAAPLTDPVPMGPETDYSIRYGRDHYIFKYTQMNRCYKLSMFRDGSCKHGYLVRPEARRIEDFSRVITDSYGPDATFFRSILLTRLIADRFCILHNLEYCESSRLRSKIYPVQNRNELVELIETRYGIPKTISGRVIMEMDLSGDAWD